MLRLTRHGEAVAIDPWPFGAPAVTAHAIGSLLDRTFTDEAEMRAALVVAPRVTLRYELVAPSPPRATA